MSEVAGDRAAMQVPVDELTDRVVSAGVIGIVRTPDAERAMASGRALLAAGLTVLEVSLVTPGAHEASAQLRAEFPAALVGVGTVVDVGQAHAAVAAGARLLVAPILDPAVLALGREAGVLVVPGAATPTECVQAARLGVRLVKLFPASLYGPTVLRDLLASLAGARLVPTGGVRIGDAAQWYAAGASALGIGSALGGGGEVEIRARIEVLAAARDAARATGSKDDPGAT